MHEDRSKEILNYLTAMTRDIGEFRAETKARFERLETETKVRFERLETETKTHFERLETEMRAGFAEARKDVRRLHHKFEVVVEKLTELKIEGRDLRKRVEVIEAKIGITDDV